MTRIEELEKTRTHLMVARESLHASMKCAVLSRSRRERSERLELAVLDLILDINEELERRGVAA